MKTRLLSLIVTLGLVLAPGQLPAQGPGRGGPPDAVPAGIDLATARTLVAAAEAAAKAADARVAIAVVDVNGDVVLFQRMDGAPSIAVTTSQGKARAAVLLGMPTKAVQDAMTAGRPVPALINAPPRGAIELTLMQRTTAT